MAEEQVRVKEANDRPDINIEDIDYVQWEKEEWEWIGRLIMDWIRSEWL